MRNSWVLLKAAMCLKVTEKAIALEFVSPDRSSGLGCWIPKSQVWKGTVMPKVGEVKDLVVREWLVEDKELPEWAWKPWDGDVVEAQEMRDVEAEVNEELKEAWKSLLKLRAQQGLQALRQENKGTVEKGQKANKQEALALWEQFVKRSITDQASSSQLWAEVVSSARQLTIPKELLGGAAQTRQPTKHQEVIKLPKRAIRFEEDE